MDALIEAADKWLRTPKRQRSAAVRDCLIARLKEAPVAENWSQKERATAATLVSALTETAQPRLGFPGCSANG